jgi:hypothetical protein
MHCAIEFQSPCCAVDALVSFVNLKGCCSLLQPRVLGNLCSVLSLSVLEAARAPVDFKPLRLHGIEAACRKLVMAFDETVFSYGWTLVWKLSDKDHLISVLVLLQHGKGADMGARPSGSGSQIGDAPRARDEPTCTRGHRPRPPWRATRRRRT